jgi:hypothetical protein
MVSFIEVSGTTAQDLQGCAPLNNKFTKDLAPGAARPFALRVLAPSRKGTLQKISYGANAESTIIEREFGAFQQAYDFFLFEKG